MVSIHGQQVSCYGKRDRMSLNDSESHFSATPPQNERMILIAWGTNLHLRFTVNKQNCMIAQLGQLRWLCKKILTNLILH